MLKYSTNLTAEAVGLTSSAARGSVPGSLSASAKAMKDWAEPNLGVGRARFVDHSGLGAASHISASEMVKALQGQPPSAALRPLLKEVSMRGKDGKPIKNHPVKIHAKTGTLNFVSGLAGYVTPPNGRELVFAIFAADEPRRAKIPKEQAERPDGGRTWLSHARRMQLELIDRWSTVYTT